MKRVLCLVLALAGCESILDIRTSRYLAEGGTCEGVLRVRILADLTGPTKDVGIPGGKGQTDYLRALGNVRGCSLDVDVADTKYDVATTLDAYRTWKSRPEWNEVSTIFVEGTPMAQAIGPLAAEDGKVLVSTALNGDLASPSPIDHTVGVPTLNGSFVLATVPTEKRSPGYPDLFMAGTDYTTSARVAMNIAWKRGAKRVGFFACTTSAYCTDPVDGAKAFLPMLGGIDVGRDLAIELDDDDATIQSKVETYFQAELAQQAKDPSYARVDWIWFGNTRTTLARLGRALDAVSTKLALTPKPTVLADNYGLDELLFGECGSACVGMLGVQPQAAFGDGTVPGMAKLLDVHRAARTTDGEPETKYATVAYVISFVAAAEWRAAAEDVIDSGKQVTGATLKDAFERFQQRSIDDLATISYAPADHRPQASARLYTLDASGKLVLVGQPIAIALQPDWLGY